MNAMSRADIPGVPVVDEGLVLKEIQVSPRFFDCIVDRAIVRHAQRTGEFGALSEVNIDVKLTLCLFKLDPRHVQGFLQHQSCRKKLFVIHHRTILFIDVMII